MNQTVETIAAHHALNEAMARKAGNADDFYASERTARRLKNIKRYLRERAAR